MLNKHAQQEWCDYHHMALGDVMKIAEDSVYYVLFYMLFYTSQKTHYHSAEFLLV